MKSFQELEKILTQLDGRGYKAYKDLQGQYQWRDFTLSIDYVQGDPFASPSRIRVTVPGEKGGFPTELYDTPHKRRAVIDFLSRVVAKNIYRIYDHVGGSGKSGLLSIGHCGQEILERNYIVIDQNRVEARLEVGLPAAGRKILGREAKEIFLEAIPKIVEASLFFKAISKEGLFRQVNLVEDQYFLRQEMERYKLVAFVANGSILPRESGVSQKPMARGAVAFQSPKEYEIELHLPNYGYIKGMGIPEGVTLIVGGGFHGKSTLLQALELGIYDHIEGDGREYLVARENAVKIKAENGRRVEKVNISPFINNLPMGQDTVRFSTENASGSTSQAANIMEALEIGTDLLLIDEDTSATNFMIRDGRMQQLVQKEKEPITPFIDRVRSFYEEKGISTILVIGGSGDYFEVADHVIMMDEYRPKEVTLKAKEIIKGLQNPRKIEETSCLQESPPRTLLKATFPMEKRGIKIKPRGIHYITYNKTEIDLRDLEQLVDFNQTNSICFILQYIMEKPVKDQTALPEVVEKVYKDIMTKGLDEVSPFRGHPGNMALPRRYEIAGALNRFRNLKIK
ncbi:ABC-ATPase domain-containing protein [Clostridium formicaceticum]|uniref:ATPase n=1 Tax=Clostridium formicaceticum TaxID=1497 RepID=A0AAC9RKJ7_9CLOT|nr:ABC-ATPase domain-containing protein [Clostridium formicaceticum]AOY78151.1 ATPase [Clostridium formicaceticum]ARE88804.1 putative ATPase of the ABC class [Clostridium formicaceticum]